MFGCRKGLRCMRWLGLQGYLAVLVVLGVSGMLSLLAMLFLGLQSKQEVTHFVDVARPFQYREVEAKNFTLSDVADVCSKTNRFLYIGILSAPWLRDKRDMVRQYVHLPLRKAGLDKCIRAEFIIGHLKPYKEDRSGLHDLQDRHGKLRVLPDEKTLAQEQALLAEAKKFGDIRRIPYFEWYHTLSDKILLALQHIVSQTYHFFLKIDDDRGPDLNLLETIGFLTGQNSSSYLYAGVTPLGRPRWSESGIGGQYAAYFAGPCYLLSRAIMRAILEAEQDTLAYMTYGSSSDDMNMGFWVAMAENQSSTPVYRPVVKWLCDPDSN